MSPSASVPAAQYLRMSTEHQQYSLDNQHSAIEAFAKEHQYRIIATYSDAGRSGLALKNRPGLMRLLQDVIAGPQFAVILVYDVSRWGRFQDADEAAHYEFICRRSGVPILYCAEQFGNDGSVASAILKNLKRTMAGEYSRELGIKVHAGQKRLVQLGFKMGGVRPFGLRRIMVSASGRHKSALKQGEYKSLDTDRVVLAPGPADEVRVVRKIFDLSCKRKWRPFRIAKYLNSQGVLHHNGKRWNHKSVRKLLENPAYVGCYVWGRTSQRLHAGTKCLPQSEWVVNPAAFPALLDERTFHRAQLSLSSMTRYRSDEELLDKLRRLLSKEGRLSQTIISKCRWVPSDQTYSRRFGGLFRAYELVGYHPNRDWKVVIRSRRTRQQLRRELFAAVERECPQIEILRLPKKRRWFLKLVTGEIVSVLLCPRFETATGQTRWQVRPIREEKCDAVLVCLLNRGNAAIQHTFVCPPQAAAGWFYLVRNDPSLEGHRVRNLSGLPNIAVKAVAEFRARR